MSILRTYNVQNPDSTSVNIELSPAGGVNVSGLSTFSGGINIGTGASISSPATNVLTLGTNSIEIVRIKDNTVHIGDRSGNYNSTTFGTSRVSICGPDPIGTTVTKANSYLAIGNNESELNGVYPITFGYTTSSSNYQPAYIAYKTTNSSAAEHGDLIFGTRNVITDTLPSERLRITSSGNIGIGTTNPTTEFEVLGSGTVASFRGTGGSSFIGIKDEDDGTLGFIGVDGGSIKLQTSGSSYADKLVVDSSGRITTPYQPAFNAYINASTHNNWTGTANSVFPFSLANLNVGNHYNTSSYRFTAPVAGNYFFYFCLSRLVDSGFSAGLRINNGNGWICVLELNQTISGSSWITHSASNIIGLSAGDYVEAQVISVTTTGSAFADGSGTYPTIMWDAWGGYLVG